MKGTKRSTKKIDTVRVTVKSIEGHKFEDILTSSAVDGREYSIKGKDVTLTVMEKPSAYVIGLIETSRRHNVPPKKNKTKKTIGGLGLGDDEGLAYANIFIYDTKTRVLMYEVNKNGCYLDHFVDFIYRCCNAKDSPYTSIDISLANVLSIDGYKKVMNMTVKKSVEFSIARPSQMIQEYNNKHGAVAESVKTGAELNSDRASSKFEVIMSGKAKHQGKSLAVQPIGIMIDELNNLLLGKYRNNLEKFIVAGYEQDSDDNKISTIDLIADRYKAIIKLDEPRENTDLLEDQRKKQIKELYQKCKSDFKEMFKDESAK